MGVEGRSGKGDRGYMKGEKESQCGIRRIEKLIKERSRGGSWGKVGVPSKIFDHWESRGGFHVGGEGGVEIQKGVAPCHIKGVLKNRPKKSVYTTNRDGKKRNWDEGGEKDERWKWKTDSHIRQLNNEMRGSPHLNEMG